MHGPPTPVYYMPEVFDVLDGLVWPGKLRHHGVCVGKVEEVLKAIEYPSVQPVQIVYKIVLQRPAALRIDWLTSLPLQPTHSRNACH